MSTMDHATMSMSMPMSSATATGTAASATSTTMLMDHSGMNHGSMNMGASGAKACKISMTWNWYTIDSCFIAKSWHVNTSAQFAGTCIGVVLMVILLEGLRRLSKEYEAYILRDHISKAQSQSSTSVVAEDADAADPDTNNSPIKASSADKKILPSTLLRRLSTPSVTPTSFCPSLFQQCMRAFLHLLQFALAYFIMLLAMYYNGYIIICIFIGAYIGSFIFSWQTIRIAGTGNGNNANEVTYCCG